MTKDIGNHLDEAIAQAGWRKMPPADPLSADDYLILLRTLFETARRDVPLARLLEGHADAVQIVRRYGNEAQRVALMNCLCAGATLGVWNAPHSEGPLLLRDRVLSGGKSYASGAGVLSHALVTADTESGAQLILLDLAAQPPDIDFSWWRTLGMQRSETHRVFWPARAIGHAGLIGRPGDYANEPSFSAGALRFVAVQAGAVAGLVDAVRADLVARGRDGDPIQTRRLADLFILADDSASTVRHAATETFERPIQQIERVAAARSSVADSAEHALRIAQQAVGLEGMFTDHPLAAKIADLSVYLRQPAPDAARAKVGRAVADQTLTVRL